MLDLFQLLSSPDVNWWTGVLWITCDVFIRLSFWRHPFTAEHPLLRHWCSDTFLQIWWRNKLILILDVLRVSTFTAYLNFWVNYCFNQWFQPDSGAFPHTDVLIGSVTWRPWVAVLLWWYCVRENRALF